MYAKHDLLLAEYETPAACLHAAEKLRDAKYKNFDAHTPFPVHGMDAAMGLKDSKLGWFVLVAGTTGMTAGFCMMYWMNAIDYPLIIGGKPPGSFPSMIPIMFELTILFSGITAVFGMFGLNQLPRHHHPIFNSDRFRSATNHRFFVSVESLDPKFDREKTKALLESTHPSHIEFVADNIDEGSAK